MFGAAPPPAPPAQGQNPQFPGTGGVGPVYNPQDMAADPSFVFPPTPTPPPAPSPNDLLDDAPYGEPVYPTPEEPNYGEPAYTEPFEPPNVPESDPFEVEEPNYGEPSYSPGVYAPDLGPVELEEPNYGEPVYTALPAPAYEAPMSTYEAPMPSYEAPMPSYEAPAPVYEAPMPVYESPMPVYEAPAPMYEAPMPAYEFPTYDFEMSGGGGRYFEPDAMQFARGGAVSAPGFSLGGLNNAGSEQEDLAGLSEQFGVPLPAEPALPAAAATPASPAAPPGLDALLARYMQPESGPTYTAELAGARRAAERESQEFQRLLQQAVMSPAEAAPSKAEMYFRLAAAFAEPGKTGAFGEGLGRAAGVLAEQKKSEREAQKASAQQRTQLGLTAQQARMQAAKEDVTTLRTLAGEEEKSKRALAGELLKEWVKKNDPASTAGKQAQDEGLVPGSPQFQSRVRQISEAALERQTAMINATVAQMGLAAAQFALAQRRDARAEEATKKLTPSEVKLKTETEDLIATADSAMGMLKRAYQLNPNTFDSSVPDTVQRKALEAAGSKDKKLLATRELENLLGEQALAKLKATFGGNPTEGERAILLSLQGIGAKSVQERDAIIKNAFRQLREARERQARRLNEINQGLYRDTGSPVGNLE